jgi:hypothetical protein
MANVEVVREGATITFWAYGADGGNRVNVRVQATDSGPNSKTRRIKIPAGTWAQIRIPLDELDATGPIARLNITDATGAPQATFYIDDLTIG